MKVVHLVRVVWVTILLSPLFVRAADTIVINDQTAFFEIAPRYISKFKDPSNSLTIQDILKKPASSFVEDDKLYTENPDASYWIKFVVDPEFENRKKWILEILDSRHYDVELYAPGNDGQYHPISTGLKHPFGSRNYLHKNLVMDLDLKAHVKTTYYLKFYSKVVGSILFKIRSNDEFSSYAFNEYYLLGIYYGIILIICLLNFILYFSLQEKIYLFYSVYVLSWGLNSMLDDGIGYQYLWSSHAMISQIGFIVANPLLLILFTFYSRLFLDSKVLTPVYDKWIVYSMFFYLINYTIDRFIAYPDGVIYFLFLVHFALVYLVSIRLYNKGFKPSRFFIMGNTFILLGFIFRFIKDLNIVDIAGNVSIFAIYSRDGAIILEICILFIALGDRFRFLKTQKEEAQEKVIMQLEENKSLTQKINCELEEKVTERTRELSEKSQELEYLNVKLEQQAIEINKWNQTLDLDNHKLKQKIKEVNEARIKSDDVSYEEFLQIFPDDLACQRYIEEIKWTEGFQCKKCSNKKYFTGARIFSRRCTRCGYSESVTAFTFLHKCKFSLVKAFYIMMKVNKYADEINCAELSRELEMRKSTVWEFKNKVLECKEGKKMDLDYLLLQNLK
ncbi:MAG: receptor [Chitinophagaceae bacterium]|nr:receptor [Chitinophagaceae bacterium]